MLLVIASKASLASRNWDTFEFVLTQVLHEIDKIGHDQHENDQNRDRDHEFDKREGLAGAAIPPNR
jgi:hypothetical protein